MTDQERLELYVRKVRDLQANTLVRDGFECGFTMKGSADSGEVQFSATQPNEELFKSMLLSLRQFISQDEPVYIFSIYNICHRVLTNETHRKYLAKSRTILKEAFKSTGMVLHIDQNHYTPKLVWDTYINGLYFHSDSEKMKAIDNLSESERALLKNELFGFVMALCNQVNYVGRIVANALENKEPSNQAL